MGVSVTTFDKKMSRCTQAASSKAFVALVMPDHDAPTLVVFKQVQTSTVC